MDSGFFAYMQQLELMSFFSGYALIYTVVIFAAGALHKKKDLANRIVSLLPFSYALVGTLYLGFKLHHLYPDYSFENIKLSIQQPLLITWGLLSLLFWIPALAKKKSLSLIHSLVFFFFFIRDLVLQLFSLVNDPKIIDNDIKVYTSSLLLNAGAVLFILIISFLLIYYKKVQSPKS
jgi:hypothetical protein